MRCFILVVLSLGICPSFGLTLEELQADPNLTPERFADYFANFDFRFRADVQKPEVFLATRAGDCDDYAILAAEVLSVRGYTPRLITVRMRKVVHVVCYIPETKSYLDFNQRKSFRRLIDSDGTLEDIARRVAASFRKRWTSASEFTFQQGRKRLVKTVLPG